ncbi:CDP-glucose 4,6-dehydratase [Candidatus Woesebacteria bacterium]|nr:MAG: CDP-glucose 4,6-dehydratase [Candidatus Woesebacteria bacterium]
MDKVNTKFWKNKKVLVTGHTGFKGGWLSMWLNHMGAQVVGYALTPPTKPSIFELTHLAKDMNSIIGDVRDSNHVSRVFKKEKPEIVIHLAGQPIVRLSYDDPLLTYTTNVIGTATVLDAARNTNSVRSVVSITSDKCYENKSWVWGYRETDNLGGNDPYSASKACAELVITSYRNSFLNKNSNVYLASARAGNVIGGGDWAKDRLIPDMIRSFTKKESVFIRNPNSTRPWQHVLEPLRGYLYLAEKLYTKGEDYAQAWNFGPNTEQVKPVSYIADFMVNLWGDGASWKTDDGKHPHEDKLLSLDNTKAKRSLGWYPKLSLDETLNWIVEWYKEFQVKGDVRQKTIDQIEKYQHL